MSILKQLNPQRPSWHIDAKWIFGIVFTFVFITSLCLFSLARVTSEKVAIPLATVVVASLFSPEGLDDEGDFEEIRKQLLLSSDDVIYPIPGQPAFVTKDDIENLSIRELRLKIFRQIVEPYYLLGVDGVAVSMTDDIDEQEEIKKEAGLLSFLNIDTHRFIYKLFYISLFPLLLSLIGLLYFSYRWGKLVSPAVVLILVTIFPALILLITGFILNSSEQEGIKSPLLIEVIPMVISVLGLIFWPIFFLGIILLLIAGIGKFWERKKH